MYMCVCVYGEVLVGRGGGQINVCVRPYFEEHSREGQSLISTRRKPKLTQKTGDIDNSALCFADEGQHGLCDVYSTKQVDVHHVTKNFLGCHLHFGEIPHTGIVHYSPQSWKPQTEKLKGTIQYVHYSPKSWKSQ